MSEGVLILAVGCLTGVLAGLLGAGGGFATVVLLLAAGAEPQVAVGTGLVYLMVMGGWGTFVHLRLGLADRRLVTTIGVAATGSALIGAGLAEMLGEGLTVTLGLFTALVSGISLAWPQSRRPLTVPAMPAAVAVEGVVGEPAPAEPPPKVDLGPTQLASGAAGGVAIGLLKGLFGVGAGFLIVPVMSSTGRLPRSLAVTSSLFAILVASVAGTVVHAALGNVAWRALIWLIPGGLFGSFVGVRAGRSMSPAATRRLSLAVMGASTVYLLVLASSY
ncbi:MAG: sulfite exporter TauE/SafE family protein [Acidimicrobiia bacterium]